MQQYQFKGRVAKVYPSSSPMSTLKPGDTVLGVKAFPVEVGKVVFHQQDVMLPGFLFAGKVSLDVTITKVKTV